MIADGVIGIFVEAAHHCRDGGARIHFLVEHLIAQALRAFDVGAGFGEADFKSAHLTVDFARPPAEDYPVGNHVLEGGSCHHAERNAVTSRFPEISAFGALEPARHSLRDVHHEILRPRPIDVCIMAICAGIARRYHDSMTVRQNRDAPGKRKSFCAGLVERPGSAAPSAGNNELAMRRRSRRRVEAGWRGPAGEKGCHGGAVEGFGQVVVET